MSDTSQNNATPIDSTEPSKSQIATMVKEKPRYGVFILALLAFLLSLAAIGGLAWQYQNSIKSQLTINQLKASITNRKNVTGNEVKQVRDQIGLMQADARTLEARLAQAEAQIHQASVQYDTLNHMYNDLTKNRSDWILSEVSHSLQMTSQHLQLTGDVKNSINALENIDKRLSEFDRPELINLKRAISGDLNALNLIPKLDVVGNSIKLDEMQENITSLPLLIDTAASTTSNIPAVITNNANKNQTFWQKMKSDIVDSFNKLVVIRRIDKPEEFLLSPNQAFFLRENLKLRLMDARLALLGRNSLVYNSDLSAVEHYVKNYFDANATQTKVWLKKLEELKKVEIGSTAPSLEASLKAVKEAQNLAGKTP